MCSGERSAHPVSDIVGLSIPTNRSSTAVEEKKMNILISLIVYLVVFGLIWWLVSMLPLPEPVAQIVRVLFIILLILIVLSVFGIIPGGYLPKLSL
jgi:antibiotic biosynthesis monooxygenase (ABM) superfamily enzyme